jgi:hypothetical protein
MPRTVRASEPPANAGLRDAVAGSEMLVPVFRGPRVALFDPHDTDGPSQGVDLGAEALDRLGHVRRELDRSAAKIRARGLMGPRCCHRIYARPGSLNYTGNNTSDHPIRA